MFGPATHTEGENLAGYLDAQLAGIRAAAYGLTDEQARQQPCRSALSIGGLITHATYVMVNRNWRRADPTALPDPDGFAGFAASFVLADDETLDDALAAFDEAREDYLADVRGLDPAGPAVEPPAPWDGVLGPRDSVLRYALVHHVEELARHAGHADIVREQLDGASAASLLMATEGRPGNDFVQPWAPEG